MVASMCYRWCYVTLKHMFRDTSRTKTVSCQIRPVQGTETKYRDMEADLVSIGEQSCARMLRYVAEPREWWDAVSPLEVGGQHTVVVHSKNLVDMPAKLFMLSFPVHGRSLDYLYEHLVDVVTRAETDDNVESAEKLFVSRQPNQDLLTVARTISMPQIGGLVQRREVTAVSLERRLDNGGLIVGSVSPQSTFFERCSFDDCLLDEAPSTDHCTLGTLVQGGVSLEPVGTCSPQDVQREWTVRLLFQVVVGGAIPAWIADMASVDSQKCAIHKVMAQSSVPREPTLTDRGMLRERAQSTQFRKTESVAEDVDSIFGILSGVWGLVSEPSRIFSAVYDGCSYRADDWQERNICRGHSR